jgi:hypothetical protein
MCEMIIMKLVVNDYGKEIMDIEWRKVNGNEYWSNG